MIAKMLTGLLLTCGACWATGVTWAQVPATADESEMTGPSIQPEHEQALIAYVEGRFNRVRHTVDADRAEARRYMNAEFRDRYEAEFNPSIALAEFKACQDCDEFRVRITRMQHVLKENSAFISNVYATNISQIEFVTVPLSPAGAEAKTMAVQLNWRPRLMPEAGDAPLEIEREDMLVRRQRISM